MKVLSALYYDIDKFPIPFIEYLLKYCYVENRTLYMRNPNIENIKEMLDGILDEWYADGGWKPCEVLIDFSPEYNCITLRDTYLESHENI